MWKKIKEFKETINVVSTVLIMVFGVSVFGVAKSAITYTRMADRAIIGFEELVGRVDSLDIRVSIIEKKLFDYDVVKENVMYLMEDNEILSSLLRANMEKLDTKDYGTVLVLYDDVEEKYVRRLVEVKMRKAKGSGDLYVFVPWGKLLGVSVTKKFTAKWHADEKSYYFVDKEGDLHLIYEIDIENTILMR